MNRFSLAWPSARPSACSRPSLPPLTLSPLRGSAALSQSRREAHPSLSMSASTSATAHSTPVVLFGPSGSGKSTLLKKLQASPVWSGFGFSVSHTTRQPRPGEEDGVAYHFVSRQEFSNMIQNRAFIEHAQFGGNCYGTSIDAVADVSERQGKRCILDIDVQGVKSILHDHPSLNPLIIFICPPSLEELKQRLLARNTESEDSLQARLAIAQSEVEYAKSGVPHLIIVNQDLEEAYKKFYLACTTKVSDLDKFLKSDQIPF